MANSVPLINGSPKEGCSGGSAQEVAGMNSYTAGALIGMNSYTCYLLKIDPLG